jgi:hypothetical protein
MNLYILSQIFLVDYAARDFVLKTFLSQARVIEKQFVARLPIEQLFCRRIFESWPANIVGEKL